MRQVHKAGEKAFVDYAGMRPDDRRRRDRRGGRGRIVRRRARRVELHLRRGDADATERGLDHEPRPRGRVFRRRARRVWVPDQLRTGVTRAVPLRAGRPADLRRVGAALSHGRSFRRGRRNLETKPKSKWPCRSPSAGSWRGCAMRPFSASTALNARIRELLHGAQCPADEGLRRALAARSLRALRSPALQPLPAERFVHADWLQARVNIDYHVEVERHIYSVPYPLVHADRSTCASRPRPSRSFSAARGSGCMRAARCRAGTPRSPSTCRRPTARIWSGVRRGLIRWGATMGPADRDARAADSRESAASRAGVSILSRPAAPGEAVRPGAAECRLCARRRRRRAVVSPRRFHAQARARSPAAPARRPRRPRPRSPMTTSAARPTTTRRRPHDD